MTENDLSNKLIVLENENYRVYIKRKNPTTTN